jgi:hypothetical protein
MINFASCFTIGKAHGWGTFSKCEARLGYHLVLGPLLSECLPITIIIIIIIIFSNEPLSLAHQFFIFKKTLKLWKLPKVEVSMEWVPIRPHLYR